MKSMVNKSIMVHIILMLLLVICLLQCSSVVNALQASTRWLQAFKHTSATTSTSALFGKGFGAVAPPSDSIDAILPPTRRGNGRRVEGSYAKLLQKQSERFHKMLKFCVTKNTTPEDKLQGQKDHIMYDIYARLEGSVDFWFIGKIAFEQHPVECSKPLSANTAIAKIETLLQEYARSLRPTELDAIQDANKMIQLWYTLGDAELDVAQNLIPLQKYYPPRSSGGSSNDEISFHQIAFQPEIYMNGAKGFKCSRDDEGNCISAPFEVRMTEPVPMPPTPST